MTESPLVVHVTPSDSKRLPVVCGIWAPGTAVSQYNQFAGLYGHPASMGTLTIALRAKLWGGQTYMYGRFHYTLR